MSQQEFMPESQEQKHEQSPDEGIQHIYPHVWPKQRPSNMPKYEHPANYEEEDIPPYSYRAQDRSQPQPTAERSYTAREEPRKQENPRPYSEYQKQRQQPYSGWTYQRRSGYQGSPNRSNGKIFLLILLGLIFFPLLLRIMAIFITVLLGFFLFSFIFVGIIAILLFFIWRNVLRNLMRW